MENFLQSLPSTETGLRVETFVVGLGEGGNVIRRNWKNGSTYSVGSSLLGAREKQQ